MGSKQAYRDSGRGTILEQHSHSLDVPRAGCEAQWRAIRRKVRSERDVRRGRAQSLMSKAKQHAGINAPMYERA